MSAPSSGTQEPVTRERDRRYGRRTLLRNLALSLPPLAALTLMWGRAHERGATFWVAAVFFVAWIAGWAVLDVVRLRRYRCPACGAPIPRPTRVERAPGDPIVFHCPRCRVEWDTGLRESGD